jgi:hypothetical protein
MKQQEAIVNSVIVHCAPALQSQSAQTLARSIRLSPEQAKSQQFRHARI